MADWRLNCKILSDFGRGLFQTKDHWDCQFQFGDQKIEAHKFLLMMNSSVFEKMFYGDFPEESIVVVEDLSFDVFTQFLQYLYCNELNFNDVKNAQDLYHAAEKYWIMSLKEMCLKYLRCNTYYNSVISILEFAQFYTIDALEKHCKEFIKKNTSKVIQSEKFLESMESTVDLILKLENVNLTSEAELIRAVIHWTTKHSIDEEKSVREVAKNLLPQLRLLLLPADEFLDIFSASEILTVDEKFAVLSRINSPSRGPLDNGLCSLTSNRNGCSARRVFQIEYIKAELKRIKSGTVLAYPFTSWRRISLLGVKFCHQGRHPSYHHSRTQYQEKVSVAVRSGNGVVQAEGSFQGTVSCGGVSKVFLSKPAIILPSQLYTIYMTMSSSNNGFYPSGTFCGIAVAEESPVNFLLNRGLFENNYAILDSIIVNCS